MGARYGEMVTKAELRYEQLKAEDDAKQNEIEELRRQLTCAAPQTEDSNTAASSGSNQINNADLRRCTCKYLVGCSG